MQTRTSSVVESDLAVIERAREGDMDACDELVTRYRARAVRLARSFVRDRELAEDMAQEAFVKTFLSLGRLKRAESFFSFLARTTVRLCIDHSRKSSSTEIPRSIESPPPDDRMCVEDVMYVHCVLEKLSWKLRQVIVLRDVNELDYWTIATILKVPVGTVRSRLSAARAAFRSLYLGGIALEKED